MSSVTGETALVVESNLVLAGFPLGVGKNTVSRTIAYPPTLICGPVIWGLKKREHLSAPQ